MISTQMQTKRYELGVNCVLHTVTAPFTVGPILKAFGILEIYVKVLIYVTCHRVACNVAFALLFNIVLCIIIDEL